MSERELCFNFPVPNLTSPLTQNDVSQQTMTILGQQKGQVQGPSMRTNFHSVTNIWLLHETAHVYIYIYMHIQIM